jgi:gamma-glutamyltranspeptidase/glutathione hydrolase
MSLADAVYAPRIHHQALPDSLQWEPNGIPPGVRRQLERMGHALRARPGYMALINAIRVTPEGLEGVSDPRTSGAAVGF